jgi:hypothetical protein
MKLLVLLNLILAAQGAFAQSRISTVDVWSCIDQGRKDYDVRILPADRNQDRYTTEVVVGSLRLVPVKKDGISDSQVYLEDKTTALKRKFFDYKGMPDYEILMEGRIFRQQPGSLQFKNNKINKRISLECRIIGSRG